MILKEIFKTFPQMKKKVIISRTLERGVGSFYKINNKDVRAKDVSILFYDSGSGPRSSSIISQGNIDQIINYLETLDYDLKKTKYIGIISSKK